MHYNTCQTFTQQTVTPFPVDAIEVSGALKLIFSDFDAIANDTKIFQNPFNVNTESFVQNFNGQ